MRLRGESKPHGIVDPAPVPLFYLHRLSEYQQPLPLVWPRSPPAASSQRVDEGSGQGSTTAGCRPAARCSSTLRNSQRRKGRTVPSGRPSGFAARQLRAQRLQAGGRNRHFQFLPPKRSLWREGAISRGTSSGDSFCITAAARLRRLQPRRLAPRVIPTGRLVASTTHLPAGCSELNLPRLERRGSSSSKATCARARTSPGCRS